MHIDGTANDGLSDLGLIEGDGPLQCKSRSSDTAPKALALRLPIADPATFKPLTTFNSFKQAGRTKVVPSSKRV
jgi:hypothetical protein